MVREKSWLWHINYGSGWVKIQKTFLFNKIIGKDNGYSK